jgi:DNA-binding response OmpR family regulator
LAAARQALAQDWFEAVLLDYDLDDGKGVEPIQELQGQARCPILVAVSSHQASNDALVAAGAHAVCSKMQFRI